MDGSAKRMYNLLNRGKCGLSVFLAAFMFIQFVVLRLGNQAGQGYLPVERQENVYFFLQVVAILGFLSHALPYPVLRGKRPYGLALCCSLAFCFAGAVVMLICPFESSFYLIVTGLTVFFLGFSGGAVYRKLSVLAAHAPRPGIGFGAGYAAAVALQFFLQLQWTVVPLIACLLGLCFAVLIVFLTAREEPIPEETEITNRPGVRSALICAVVVTVSLLIFTSYYNRYIHHLQIASGYTEYNVYSWPRLLMIPAVLLFGALADLGKGKLLPLGTLCMVVLALMNTMLIGRKTYLLNMSLYYIAMTAVIAYYNLVFIRIAPRTAHPALWAPMGRMIDSAAVILSFLVRLVNVTPAAALMIDVAALVVVIVTMSLNGDFNLKSTVPGPDRADIVPDPAPDTDPVPDMRAMPDADPFDEILARYRLTPGEMKVFRELVLTEDKQSAIGDRLSIKLRTVQANVTSIYRKTGVSTRAGLVQIYLDACIK